MRIENNMQNFYIEPPQIAVKAKVFAQPEPQKIAFGTGVTVEISPEARAAWKSVEKSNGYQGDGLQSITAAEELQGCQTCKNRKYVDQSTDASVSFQSPEHINPGQAAGRVMAHEREHISNDQVKAFREDRRVVSQTITLSTSICPECGRMYISGGSARTVTAKDNSTAETEQQKTGEKNG